MRDFTVIDPVGVPWRIAREIKRGPSLRSVRASATTSPFNELALGTIMPSAAAATRLKRQASRS